MLPSLPDLDRASNLIARLGAWAGLSYADTGLLAGFSRKCYGRHYGETAHVEKLECHDRERFPKKCGNCGRAYTDMRSFLSQTSSLPGNQDLIDYAVKIPTLVLYRNCVCHSTMIVHCKNRRDTSAEGLRRRAIFDILTVLLNKDGFPSDLSRFALLELLYGFPNMQIENFLRENL